MKELLPCPFCGGKAVFKTIANCSSHYDVSVKFTIKCSGCGMELPKGGTIMFRLADDGNIISDLDARMPLLKAWNERRGKGNTAIEDCEQPIVREFPAACSDKMTKTEAIELIERNKSVFQYDDEMLQALEVAIGALEYLSLYEGD